MNIAKIALFVILSAGGWVQLGCGGGGARTEKSADFEFPQRVGSLREADLTEASGLAASKCQPDVYWTHNDSGNGAYLYAIDGAGTSLGVWHVTGATNRDWEDIAAFKDDAGKCFVLVGDIGNNELKKEQFAVYRIAEPTVDAPSKAKAGPSPRGTTPADVFDFRYPDTRRNAETLLVHPVSGEIYVLTKSKSDPVTVYKLKPDFSGANQTADKIAEFTVPAVPNGLLTGGDISADGRHLVVCDYVYGYELSLPALSTNFDDIWKQQPRRFDLGDRPVGEAVAFTRTGDAVLSVSEEANTPVFLVRRK